MFMGFIPAKPYMGQPPGRPADHPPAIVARRDHPSQKQTDSQVSEQKGDRDRSLLNDNGGDTD